MGSRRRQGGDVLIVAGLELGRGNHAELPVTLWLIVHQGFTAAVHQPFTAKVHHRFAAKVHQELVAGLRHNAAARAS